MNKQFYKDSLKMLFPIILQNIFAAMMGSVDVIMLNSVGQDAIAAGSLATQSGQTHVKIFCFKSLNYYLKNAQNGKIPLGWNYAFKRKSGRNRRF